MGCTGPAVYLYNQEGTQLAKFEDIRSACDAAFSPEGDLFVVKSSVGWLAIYSAKRRALVKKLRFSHDDGQDQGFSFTSDGAYFYNIEYVDEFIRPVSAIGVYRAPDFKYLGRLKFTFRYLFSFIECDTDGRIFVLGMDRRAAGDPRFVARLCGDRLLDPCILSDEEYWFYCGNQRLLMSGNAEKTVEWMKQQYIYRGIDFKEMGSRKHSLAELWERKHMKK